MPKISVCIPTYNRKNYLKETLATVFCQTYTDYEVIVVDDGSTDGTDKMIASMNKPLRYFKKDNGGDASARNKLIQLARGDYICFIDSDDLLYPDSIERLISSVEKYNGKAIGYGGYVRIDEHGNDLPTKLKRLPSGQITIPLFQQIIVHSCGSIFPAEALKKLGGFNASLRVCSDYAAWLVLSKTYTFIAQDKPTFKRRRHSSNLSALSFDNILTEHDVLEDFYYNKDGYKFVPESVALPRLARECYRVSKAARVENKGMDIVYKYLSMSVKRHWTLKTIIKLFFLKIQMINIRVKM